MTASRSMSSTVFRGSLTRTSGSTPCSTTSRAPLTRAHQGRPEGREHLHARNADALVARARGARRTSAAVSRRSHPLRPVSLTAHEAFGHLAHRYGLRQQGVAGIDPSAEPDARRIAQLSDLVEKEGVTVVFTESLLSSRVADTLAREAGVKTETLDPLEGLSSARQASGADYFSVMDANLRKLQAALGVFLKFTTEAITLRASPPPAPR